jgi:hypothetical protein
LQAHGSFTLAKRVKLEGIICATGHDVHTTGEKLAKLAKSEEGGVTAATTWLDQVTMDGWTGKGH